MAPPLSAAALAYARAHRALQRATPKPWIIRTPETRARIEAKRLAMVRAEGALCRAARARRRPSPIQDLMLAYRAEAAEAERWLAEITAALGLPADATQAERVERARALAARAKP